MGKPPSTAELQGLQEGTGASPPLACLVTSADGSSPLYSPHFTNRPRPPLRSPKSRDHLPLGQGGWVWVGAEGTVTFRSLWKSSKWSQACPSTPHPVAEGHLGVGGPEPRGPRGWAGPRRVSTCLMSWISGTTSSVSSKQRAACNP